MGVGSFCGRKGYYFHQVGPTVLRRLHLFRYGCGRISSISNGSYDVVTLSARADSLNM